MTTSSSLARRPTTAERVLALLAEQGGAEGLTRAEIGRALSVPHGTVDRAVIALLEPGAAHKAKDGLPGRYLPTGRRAFTPRGHLASTPLPTGHRARHCLRPLLLPARIDPAYAPAIRGP